MSVQILYKNEEIALIENESNCTLSTQGTYLEDDINIIDTTKSTIHNNPTVSINNSTGLITASHAQGEGYINGGTTTGTLQLSTQAAKTVTPTENSQTAVAKNIYTTGVITVNAIPSTYVGSGVAKNDSDDLTVSGATVSVPTGYYAEAASKSVATTTHPAPTASVNNTTGLVTASHTQGTGYVTGGTTTGTLQLSTVDGTTITPTESEQTAVAINKFTLGAITVDAIPSNYVGSSITRNPIPTASGATVTIPAGYYSSQTTKSVSTMTLPTAATSSISSGYTSKATISRSTSDQYINIPPGYNSAGAYYKISAVANGTAGTPSATKGTVSNNSISITPTVTNVTGYITGGTKTGTAVTVTAAELVSGTQSITANGTGIDVTNYATVDVAIPSDINNQNKTVTPTKSQQSITADSGYSGLGTVTVNAIPSQYIVTTDADATAAQILNNKTAYVNGSKVTGTMPNNGATGTTIRAQGGTYTIPAGYTTGGTVTASLTASSITNTAINGAAFEEESGDYGFRTTVTIPAGYYNETTLTKEFSTILPAPETEGVDYQVLSGYSLYNHDGILINGTMTNNGTWNRTLSDSTTSVTIPAGYHSGSGKVSISTVAVPNPTISISAAGVITASGSWTKGYTTNSSYSNTKTMTTKAATTITPTESEQTAVAANTYTTGIIKVDAISSTYIGSGVTQRDSDDLTTSGATVSVPAGYYVEAASKSVSTMTLPTSAASSATNGYTSKATISRSTSAQYINIPPGYNSTGGYYTISAVPNGSVTAPSSISGTSATVSTGTNTLILTKTVSVTPNVTTAGYISSGTAGNSSVSLTASITTQAAKTVTPTESEQTAVASGVYTTGIVKVGAISSTYVGSGIAKDPELIVSDNTVTVPAGYYSEQATGIVTAMTLPTSAASSATSGYTSKATIGRSTSAQYINIPPGYNSAGAYYVISATPNGSVTAPSSISGTTATVSTGTNTLTLTKTVSVTPNVTTAGYISSGTAGNSSVSLTASVTTKAAATYNVSASNQTIAAGTYLTGAQTIRAVTHTATAAKIAAGQTVTIGDAGSATRIANVSGTFTSDATAAAADIIDGETAYVNGSKITGSLIINTVYTGSSTPSSSLGENGDIYIQA